MKSDARTFFLSGARHQELQIQPDLLSAVHWDLLAEAANLSKQYADILSDVHWIGGDPSRKETYGYGSYLCPPSVGLFFWRNPSDGHRNVSFTLRHALSLPRIWPGGSVGGVWRIQSLWAPLIHQKDRHLSDVSLTEEQNTSQFHKDNISTAPLHGPTPGVMLDQTLNLELAPFELQAFKASSIT